MSEGLFKPEEFHYWVPDAVIAKTSSICRIYPNRKLEFHLVKAGVSFFEPCIFPDGSEVIRIGISKEALESKGSPDLELSLFKYEAIRHYRNGGTFPAVLEIEGSATGFFAQAQNLLFSSCHVVSSAVQTAISKGLRSGYDKMDCPGLLVKDSKNLLISESPTLIYWPDQEQIDQGFDVAVFELEGREGAYLKLSSECSFREQVYMIGFPMRTARDPEHTEFLGYSNANYDLRLSSGQILKIEQNNLVADCDGGPGNSGSPLINASGEVIGLYKGSYGSGISSWNGVMRSYLQANKILELVEGR